MQKEAQLAFMELRRKWLSGTTGKSSVSAKAKRLRLRGRDRDRDLARGVEDVASVLLALKALASANSNAKAKDDDGFAAAGYGKNLFDLTEQQQVEEVLQAFFDYLNPCLGKLCFELETRESTAHKSVKLSQLPVAESLIRHGSRNSKLRVRFVSMNRTPESGSKKLKHRVDVDDSIPDALKLFAIIVSSPLSPPKDMFFFFFKLLCLVFGVCLCADA